MRYIKKIKQLGISEKDFKLLKALFLEKQSKVLPLSKKINIARTSVSFRLLKLKGRDFVEQKKVGGHFEWMLTDSAENLFLKDSKNEEDVEITKYNGKKNIEKLLLSILKNKSKERIYFIEPYLQTKKFIKLFGAGASELAKIFQEKKNISEGVSSEKNIELIEKYNKSILKNMLGRMTIIYLVPDKNIFFEDMIFVYKSEVYFFNFEKLKAKKIKSEALAKAVKFSILTLKNTGKKVDLNGIIKAALKSRV